MDSNLLQKYIRAYKKHIDTHQEEFRSAIVERRERVMMYQAWDKNRLLTITTDGLEEYLSKLWAMLTWGNKRYYVELIVERNSIETVRKYLADLIYSEEPIATRWDRFLDKVLQIGPAMASELLAHHFPDSFPVWNRKAKEALERLGEKNLPIYNYQITGEFYNQLIQLTSQVAEALKSEGFTDVDQLLVDYFFWDLLEEFPEQAGPELVPEVRQPSSQKEQLLVHNEIRDKIAQIGDWLGFKTNIEQTITTGTRVDVVWEASIGNMGRVLYAFEVQGSGSIDSLQINLLRTLNNPAVQAVVAVSDERQLEKIRAEVNTLPDLPKKIKYWDFREVLETHGALMTAFTSINKLNLVPEPFSASTKILG